MNTGSLQSRNYYKTSDAPAKAAIKKKVPLAVRPTAPSSAATRKLGTSLRMTLWRHFANKTAYSAELISDRKKRMEDGGQKTENRRAKAHPPSFLIIGNIGLGFLRAEMR